MKISLLFYLHHKTRMHDIDIEELDKKGKMMMEREFIKPNQDDVIRLKPLILELLSINKVLKRNELESMKRKHNFSGKFSFLYQVYLDLVSQGEISGNDDGEQRIRKILQIKAVKDWSGVCNVTVFTSPYPEYEDDTGTLVKQSFTCRHDCHYCPNAPGMPRSYLLLEPATIRAARNEFDCVRQMHDRLYTLYITSHEVVKIEVNVLGGSWCAYPMKYREKFVNEIYYACNVFWDTKPFRPMLSLDEEKRINETAKTRVVQVVIETRPDDIKKHEVEFMRRLGVTRVQIGIQHIDDEILRKINRKCTTKRAIQAIETLKSIGMKIDCHFMPNLPFSSPEKDREMLVDVLLGLNGVKYEVKNTRTYWDWLQGKKAELEYWEYYDLKHPELQSDQLKIYETAVTIYTEIEKWYKEGTYVPYETKELLDILVDFKSKIFPWYRINRIQRDFYADNIYSTSGSNLSLRCEIVDKMKKLGKVCRCIRCTQSKLKDYDPSAITRIRKYNASNADEYFISIETLDGSTLFGYLRLRLDNAKDKMFPELNGAALIREIHVFSQATQVGKKGVVQHNGLGTRLMDKAEKIAKEKKYNKVSVIAAVGSRTFYYKLGYQMDVGLGEYMFKCI